MLFAANAFAASYIVPTDRDMVRRSHAIVVATAANSYTRLTAAGGIETITTFHIEEVLMGPLVAAQIDAVEPGGVFENRAQSIAGVPQFAPGARVLLFLRRTPQQTWAVTDLGLGKFSLVSDRIGRPLAVRDGDDIVGWDLDGQPHREQQRSAERFLEFLRTEARGGVGDENYVVTPVLLAPAATSIPKFNAAPNAFTATSYTLPISGSTGSRWNVFPSAVSILSQNTEPGAPGNGVTAIQAACSNWSNKGGSNASLSYGGATGGTSGLTSPDGKNTVIFEHDLTSHGISAFSCGSGGVLGIGGITNASGSNTVNGEPFITTLEGDVEMNQGIANCTSLFTSGNWNTAVTHEVGHTLGFRHSDQTRSGGTPCSSDPSLECSSSAVMRSSIPSGINGALQTWDLNAVAAVYPGPCTAPSITRQPSDETITSGGQANLSVAAAGSAPLSYLWYTGTPPSGPVAPGPNNTSSTYNPTPTTTTTYWVRVTNSCNHVDSAVATVTVNPASCTPPSITTQPQSQAIVAGGQANLSVNASGTAPLSYQWYVGNPPNTSTPAGTGQSINPSPTQTTNYWVRVTGQCGTPADSNGATVTVSSGCTRPFIVNDPPDQSITGGTSATLFVGYSGTTSTVTWYRGQQNDTSTPVGSGQSFQSVPLFVTTQFWALVANNCGSAASRTVTVTVTSSCIAPVLTLADAAPKNVAPGGVVTLTAQATGTGLQFQWYRGTKPDTTNPVPGGNNAVATDTPQASASYWVRVSNTCGSQDSDAIAVTVAAACLSPSITGITSDTTISSNQTATLVVTAAGDATLHYQWYQGASGNTSTPVGIDNAQFTTPALFADTQYWVKVLNACAPPASSQTVKVTVIPAKRRAARH